VRSFSIQAIAGLCLLILVVDIMAYFWLQSITDLLSSEGLKLFIDILFWVFTTGLITAIMLLKIRLDAIPIKRRQALISNLYGLTVSSLVPKFIFVLVISTLYLLDYSFTPERSRIIVPMVGLFSGVLPFTVVVYGIFKAAYRFKVYRVHTSHSSLPRAFHKMRIVQLSDLHLGSFNHRYHVLNKAIQLVNRLEPDLVVLTGDMVNNYSWELDGWDKIFGRIKAGEGKFAILGNHDYGDYSKWPSQEKKEENSRQIREFFDRSGFRLLRNESVIIQRGEHSINLIGVENWSRKRSKNYADLEKAMANTNIEAFSLLLSHDPDHWHKEVVGHTDIDLTLSGHTHGMQAGFRFKNQQWSPIKYKFKHWAGLYRQQEQYLYVNRGLGWLGFPGRIGMRPEITLLELHKPAD
jgi:predicted MPP superfamily phosphohydrolase